MLDCVPTQVCVAPNPLPSLSNNTSPHHLLQPLSLTSSWPTTPRVRLEECAAHERHAGSHPSLAEGYILHIPLITHRHRRSAVRNPPPATPHPLSSFQRLIARSLLSPSRSLLADAWVGCRFIWTSAAHRARAKRHPSPGPTLEVLSSTYIMKYLPLVLVYFCGFARYLYL